LKKEIELLKKLEHKNLVKYKGCEQVDQKLCIYLEYVDAGSVASVIDNFGPLKESVIKNYTKQILEGIAYLHDNKVILLSNYFLGHPLRH